MTTARQQLTDQQISDLRRRSLINENEFAYVAGDLVVAENPVTNERRVLGEVTLLSENKRLLKG